MPAVSGALFSAVGPVKWAALRAGHHVADGSGTLEKIVWIFSTSILFLGFPRAAPSHPRVLLIVHLATLGANVVIFAMIALLLRDT